MSNGYGVIYNKIEFDRVYGYRVGSISVVLGRLKQDEATGSVVFAARTFGA